MSIKNKESEPNLDYILYEVLRDTENNNNISVLTTWSVTDGGTVCYYNDPRLSYQYTFTFTVKSLFIESGDWITKKHFYYTDDKILNLFLTMNLGNLNNRYIRMYETVKTKVILSLL